MISFSFGAVFLVHPGLNCAISASKRYTPVGEEDMFGWTGRYDLMTDLPSFNHGDGVCRIDNTVR